MSERKAEEFSKLAQEQSPGLVREIVGLMRSQKAWWMAPILLALLALGALVVVSSSAAAPLIYTLF